MGLALLGRLATHVRAGSRISSSLTNIPSLTGYLAVEDVDNKFVGYLASSLDEGGILLANFTDVSSPSLRHQPLMYLRSRPRGSPLTPSSTLVALSPTSRSASCRTPTSPRLTDSSLPLRDTTTRERETSGVVAQSECSPPNITPAALIICSYAYQTLSSDIIPNGPPQVGGNLIDTHYGIGLTQENQIVRLDGLDWNTIMICDSVPIRLLIRWPLRLLGR